MFVETLVNGILFGSTYSLVAIGFTLIFGVIHRLNVAHGATIMVAAYAGATVSLLLGGDSFAVLGLAFLTSVAAGAALGWLVERIAFRPLRGASYLAPFVTTSGITIILEEVFLKLARRVPIFHPEFTAFPSPLEDAGFYVGDVFVRGVYLVTFCVALLLMAALHHWVSHTKSGRALRVVEENRDVAALLGIDVRRTEVLAFLVASALAGAAGCLIGISAGTIDPFMGTHLLIVSFVVIVLGGLGSIHGAMLAGILVGVIEAISAAYVSQTFGEVSLFLALFATLVLRPSGLFGWHATARD
jgi:branched-chain amino acid transport system permease protein